ncbi:MAG: hypothetical protein AAFO04_13470 [Cyanobacteria bacterium J06592_8]
MEKNNFSHPDNRSRGEGTPENIAFERQLQQFSQQVSMIVGLHTGGKLSSQESYQRIKHFWKQVKAVRKELRN